jgi:hypothetical protein
MYIINNVYNKSGIVYHKGRLSLSNVYLYMLEYYYRNGLRIHDDEEFEIFSKKIQSVFGEIKLPNNKRAIVARIQDIGVTCDRGKYINPKEKYISDELISKIHQYITEKDRLVILTNSVFEDFKDELILEGIDNRYYLHGIIKEIFGDEFSYKKDYILKEGNDASFYDEVIKFIEVNNNLVTKEDIRQEFPGITEIMINMTTLDPDIINLFGKYIHLAKLNINDHNKRLLKSIIKRLVSDDRIHHSKELYKIVEASHPDICRRLFINSAFSSFSLFESLFNDEFNFQRPYITKPGVEIEHAYDRLIEYVKLKKEIEVKAVLKYTKNNHYIVYNILDLLNSLNQFHFIQNKEKLIRFDTIGLDEIIYKKIEEIIFDELGDKVSMPISQISSIHLFPTINCKWTMWLIYSSINRWGKKLAACTSIGQFRYTIPFLVKKDMMDCVDVDDYTTTQQDEEVKMADDLDEIEELLDEDDLFEDDLDKEF